MPEDKEDRGGSSGGGDDDDNNMFITVMEASNMVRRLQHFVMTNKDVLVHALNSCKILQELTDKSLRKQPAHHMLWAF